MTRTDCCRFETESDNTKIAKGINLAESLKILNLSYNGITADTAFALLSSVNGNRAKLQTLRLDNVWVKPEFYKVGRVDSKYRIRCSDTFSNSLHRIKYSALKKVMNTVQPLISNLSIAEKFFVLFL